MSIINDALKKAGSRINEEPAVSEFTREAAEQEINQILQFDTEYTKPQLQLYEKSNRLPFFIVGGVFLACIAILAVIFFLKLGFNREHSYAAKPTVLTEDSTQPSAAPAQVSPAQSVVIQEAKKDDKGRFRPEAIKEFVKLPTLNLSGIIKGRGEPMAIIDNKVIGVGDMIKGAFVVKIGSDSVNMVYKDQEFVLRIK